MSDTFDQLFDLHGRVVVLTGGYGQIGRTLARALLERKVKLAILEPTPDPVMTAEVLGEFSDSEDLLVIQADVTDRTSLVSASEIIQEQLGMPWGLINNAALDSPPDCDASETGPFEEYPEESWDKVMSVNTKGVFLCCQVFGKLMAEQGGGSIINVASIYGTVSPDQNLYEYRRSRGEVFYKPVAYSASKSALYNLTRYVAVYWGAKNVRCNTVTFAGVFNHQDEEFLKQYGAKIPLRRLGDEGRAGMAMPTDYIGVNVFLLSDASSYMTGADLRIDGGFLAV